jgi:ABC-type glycerol-3-phosphate transport system substrate-binding protein
MVTTRLLIALTAATVALAACGKKADAPKTAAEIQAEKDATAKAVRSNALTAAPMAGYDKAKDMQKAVDKQAEETSKKIDEQTK